MDEPEFWGAAMMQGGGMGIYGDYLFGSVNRFGGGFAGSLAGPVTSRASNLWNLTGGNVIQFAQDEPTNLGRESVAFARMNLSMPFYLRLAYERVLLDDGLHQRLSAGAIEHAAEFGWDRTAKQTLGVYQRAAENLRTDLF